MAPLARKAGGELQPCAHAAASRAQPTLHSPEIAPSLGPLTTSRDACEGGGGDFDSLFITCAVESAGSGARAPIAACQLRGPAQRGGGAANEGGDARADGVVATRDAADERWLPLPGTADATECVCLHENGEGAAAVATCGGHTRLVGGAALSCVRRMGGRGRGSGEGRAYKQTRFTVMRLAASCCAVMVCIPGRWRGAAAGAARS